MALRGARRAWPKANCCAVGKSDFGNEKKPRRELLDNLNLVRKMCSSDCVRILRINSASASRRMTRGSQWFGYQLPKASLRKMNVLLLRADGEPVESAVDPLHHTRHPIQRDGSRCLA